MEQIKPSLGRLESSVASFDEYMANVRSQPYFGEWWDPRIETYYRADVTERADGSVKPRSSPDHIQQAIEGTLTVEWSSLLEKVQAPTLLVRATGAFGPSGYPPILPSDVAARTIGILPDGRSVDVEGNHITAFFGDGAGVVADAIRSFVVEET